MFEYKGTQYTYNDLMIEAGKQGLDTDTFISRMKKNGMTEVSDSGFSEKPPLVPGFEEFGALAMKQSDKDKLPRGWFSQAMRAGGVNAELYDPTEKIFDITSAEDARKLSEDEYNVYIDLMKQSAVSAQEMEELQNFSKSFAKYDAQEGSDMFSSTIAAVQETGMKGFAQATIQSFRGMMNAGAIEDAASAAGVGAGFYRVFRLWRYTWWFNCWNGCAKL